MVWLVIPSTHMLTGAAIEMWISGFGFTPAGRGDPEAFRIVVSTRGLVASDGCGGMRLFRTAKPSVAGFLRSMLGRGDEPCAGALVLVLWE